MSGKSSKRKYAKLNNCSVEFVQMHLLQLLALITFYIDASMDATNKKIANVSIASAPKVCPPVIAHLNSSLPPPSSFLLLLLTLLLQLFSFAASSAFSTPDEGEDDVEYEQLGLGPVTPYNLPPLYPLITAFVDAISNRVLHGAVLAPSKDIAAPNGAMVVIPVSQILKSWIDDYVNNTFLQNIKSDYKLRAIKAADSAKSNLLLPKYTLELMNLLQWSKCLKLKKFHELLILLRTIKGHYSRYTFKFLFE